MTWGDVVYIDTVLPHGLQSAPKLFNAVAEWVLRASGISYVFHYLDNFLLLDPPHSPKCAQDLSSTLGCVDWLGLPVAEEGSVMSLTLLGIEIDTEALVLAEKLVALKLVIGSWKGRQWCRKDELRSLAGKLQHACTVVGPGRSFIRVHERIRGTHESFNFIRINHAMSSDLDMFLESWNGVSILWASKLARPDQEFYSDASGVFGCGAI